MAFLQENLRHCAVPANHLIREARLAGISERTLRRAKFKLGVISRVWPYGTRQGDRWSWELPKAEEPPLPAG
jgi:hypothetical protein